MGPVSNSGLIENDCYLKGEQMSHTIHTGDSAETLKQYPDNHFDSIVTDPHQNPDFDRWFDDASD